MRPLISAAAVAVLALASTVALPAVSVAEHSAGLRLTASTSLLMPGTKIGNVLPPDEFTAYAQGFITQTTGSAPTPELLGVPGEFWPVTGLNSLTFGQSVTAGQAMLSPQVDAAIADGNQVVIFGHSQSAVIATKEKERLLAEHPGLEPGDVTFVLVANPNTPNGGLLARFPGLYIPLLDVPFNGSTPTDQPDGPLETHNIAIQYDGWTDFPAYPLNLVAVANAVLGIYYLHNTYYDLPPDTLADPDRTITQEYGDTTYYLVKTAQLPLLRPLRDLGVPDQFVDALEPFVRYVVELGYDRETPYGEPTPARLFPPINLNAVLPKSAEPTTPPESVVQHTADLQIETGADGEDLDEPGTKNVRKTERLRMTPSTTATNRPTVRESLRAVTGSVRDAFRRPATKPEAPTLEDNSPRERPNTGTGGSDTDTDTDTGSDATD